jgi:hypothetical protein
LGVKRKTSARREYFAFLTRSRRRKRVAFVSERDSLASRCEA